jgi:imidazolonepropionase-like amidohydrolase
VADKIAKHGASGSTFGDWWAYKMEVVDAIPHNAYLLHKNGVNTVINSDDPEMGRRLNQEAAKSIKYTGLDATSAFNFVTINPAKALHLDKRTGSITEGKDADVVVWSADPLTIDGIPEYTIVDGIIYYDRSKAKEIKAELDKEKNRLIQKSIIAKRGGEPIQPAAKKKAKNYECDTIESDYLEE